MDKLRAIQLFVRLARLGSFTQVAEQTNRSKSMVSKEIGRLEESLGTRLLHRSTRNVQLTHAGENYLLRAQEILSKLDDADHFIQNLNQELRGKLKINVPMALGITDLSKLFADFMEENPDIELDIHLGDENIDLVEQGFDLGIRASSTILDSNYIGKPLTQFPYRICASPQYLKQHPPINSPQDLSQHNCFIYSYFQGKNIWPIEGGVPVSGNLRVNNTLFMMETIKRGLGIGFIPDFICREAIINKEVVEVLPHTNKANIKLYALYPARKFASAKLIKCIEYMQYWFNRKNMA